MKATSKAEASPQEPEHNTEEKTGAAAHENKKHIYIRIPKEEHNLRPGRVAGSHGSPYKKRSECECSILWRTRPDNKMWSED